MRILIAVGLAGAALVSLTACNKPAPGPTASGAAPGVVASVTSVVPGPITMDQIPHRKPGLWQQTMTMDGAASPMPATQICVDAASEAKMTAFAQQISGAHCSPPALSRNLDGSMTMSESCDMGQAGKIDTTGDIKGDFNSSYTVVMHSKTTGSPVAAMNGDHTMTLAANWVGPCAPGQKGGDMVMANGMKMNALDAAPARPGRGAVGAGIR